MSQPGLVDVKRRSQGSLFQASIEVGYAEVADSTIRNYVEVVKPLLNHEVIVETVDGSIQGRLLNFEKVAAHTYVFILLQNYPNWLIIPESHVITVKKA